MQTLAQIEPQNNSRLINELTDVVNKISNGDYSQSSKIFELTKNEGSNSEISELAESIGFMTVKLEGREFRLEQVIEDLKIKKIQLEEENRTRLIFTVILSIVIIGFSFYTFVFALMRDSIDIIRASAEIRGYFNYAITLFFAFIIIVGIKVSGRSKADFGLSLKNWRISLIDGFLYSIPWMIAATIAKLYLINNSSQFSGHQLIDFSSEPLSMYIIYLVFLSFQEFFARGMLQGPMEFCLVGKYSKWLAISMAALVFGVSHLHYSILMATVSAITGIQFGWLYSKHKTLVAPITSHFFIGVWALGPLGFMPYFLIS